MSFNKVTLAAAVAALVAGAACSGKSGQLSVSAKAQTSAGASSGSSGGTLDLGQGLSVSEVQLVVKRISLHLPESESSADGGTDDSSSHSLTAARSAADQGGGSQEGEIENESESDEVKIGPFLVDLKGDALTGATLSKVFDAADVPTGTFREIKVIVAPDASVAPDGSSVTITGAITGASSTKGFTFKSSLHAAQKIESFVTIGADSTQNVTLSIDPSGWFKDSAGNLLDPTDPANQSQIEDNIRKSIKGFCDHDRDGEDDATEHGGSDGGTHS